MDFVHDQFDDARRYHIFAVVDNSTRESVATEAATSLAAAKDTRPCHRTTRAARRRRPVHSARQAHAESLCRFRDECLNTHWFRTLPQARHAIAEWRRHYNTERPHGALGKQTSEEFRLTYLFS